MRPIAIPPSFEPPKDLNPGRHEISLISMKCKCGNLYWTVYVYWPKTWNQFVHRLPSRTQPGGRIRYCAIACSKLKFSKLVSRPWPHLRCKRAALLPRFKCGLRFQKWFAAAKARMYIKKYEPMLIRTLSRYVAACRPLHWKCASERSQQNKTDVKTILGLILVLFVRKLPTSYFPFHWAFSNS